MISKHFTIAAVLSFVSAGCAQNSMTGDPFAIDELNPLSNIAAGRGGAGEDQQSAYRREILKNQLRQSQLDLQTASTPEEHGSVQQRIKIIQAQLRRLGDEG